MKQKSGSSQKPFGIFSLCDEDKQRHLYNTYSIMCDGSKHVQEFECVCVAALLHILENPNSLQQWLRDTDMNPLLVQISRIYHAEKYGQ